MSKAESSSLLDVLLPLPLLLEMEPPIESMVLPLSTTLPGLLHPKGVFCCPTVFVAFFASILIVASSLGSCLSIGH